VNSYEYIALCEEINDHIKKLQDACLDNLHSDPDSVDIIKKLTRLQDQLDGAAKTFKEDL
jgi:hypothetical protein